MIKKVPAKVTVVLIFCDVCGKEMGFTGETTPDGKMAYQCKDETCNYRLMSSERYPFTDIAPDYDRVAPANDGKQLLNEDGGLRPPVKECSCGEDCVCSDGK